MRVLKPKYIFKDITVDSTFIQVDTILITVDQTQYTEYTIDVFPIILRQGSAIDKIVLRREINNEIYEPTFFYNYGDGKYYIQLENLNNLIEGSIYEMVGFFQNKIIFKYNAIFTDKDIQNYKL